MRGLRDLYDYNKLYSSRTEVDDGIHCNSFPENKGSKD